MNEEKVVVTYLRVVHLPDLPRENLHRVIEDSLGGYVVEITTRDDLRSVWERWKNDV